LMSPAIPIGRMFVGEGEFTVLILTDLDGQVVNRQRLYSLLLCK
jgi:hypothetical protein